jgi:hypothetical protein
MGMQRLVQGDSAFVGQAFNATILRIATPQLIVLAGQLAGGNGIHFMALIIQ